MPRTRWISTAVLATAAALLLGACSSDDGGDVRSIGDDSGPESVTGTEFCVPVGDIATADTVIPTDLREWAIIPETDSVGAGSIGFATENTGAESHEMVVARAESIESLPTAEDGAVDEAAFSGDQELIGEVEAYPSGDACDGTFEMDPGDYVLFCNIVEEEPDGRIESHFAEGMATTFTVTP